MVVGVTNAATVVRHSLSQKPYATHFPYSNMPMRPIVTLKAYFNLARICIKKLRNIVCVQCKKRFLKRFRFSRCSRLKSDE